MSIDGDRLDDNQSGDPYRPPPELSDRRAGRSPFEAFNIAAFLWMALSIKLVVARYFLGAMFGDFGIELPLLTRFLLHPMASVFFFATAATVITSGLALNSPAQRRRLGRIALVLAIAAIVVSIIGLVTPLISLTLSLS